MRLPVVPQISTKDGVSNKNARLTNCLKEVKKAGEKAVVRPGLVLDAQASGVGNGLVVFNNELVSVYGATLGIGVTETTVSAAFASYGAVTGFVCNTVWHNGTQYVAVGYHTGTFVAEIYTSTDGESWTSRTTPSPSADFQTANSLTWTGTYWLACADNSNDEELYVFKSSDGITWSATSTGGVALVTNSQVCWDGTYSYVCVDGSLYRSSDGVSWAYMNNFNGTLGLASGNGVLVGIGFDSGAPYSSISITSNSGVTVNHYTPTSSQNITTMTGVCFDGTRFVAISGNSDGASGASVLSSITGADFTEISTISTFDTTATVNRIVYDNGVYVATSSNGVYAVSTDAEMWVEYSEPGYAFRTVGLGIGRFSSFAVDTPSSITTTAGTNNIPALATITGDYYDFAQSPL